MPPRRSTTHALRIRRQQASTERLTALQIEARLATAIACHPGCCGFRIEVAVHRLDAVLTPTDVWSADFHATGAAGDRDDCEIALQQILERAQARYVLALDS